MSDYRPLVVRRIERHSVTAKSFYLTTPDGSPLQPYVAGQHLPLRLTVPGRGVVQRPYTLSRHYVPGEDYRLTVKREANGIVSQFLHETLREGDRLEAKSPAGSFVLNSPASRPVVFVAGGVGLTPLLAMLGQLADEEPARPVRFFYAVRNGEDHLLDEKLRALLARMQDGRLHVAYSRPTAADLAAAAHDHTGRWNAAVLHAACASLEPDYYLCGPGGMMSDIVDGLTAADVARERIRTETFGPRPLASDGKTASSPAEGTSANGGITVRFDRSDKTIAWPAGCASLLQLAEQHGVEISSGCQYGDCGICSTRLLSGQVHYAHPTGARPDPGNCLPCSCTPVDAVTLDA